jgi:hypothetical protein
MADSVFNFLEWEGLFGLVQHKISAEILDIPEQDLLLKKHLFPLLHLVELLFSKRVNLILADFVLYFVVLNHIEVLLQT